MKDRRAAAVRIAKRHNDDRKESSIQTAAGEEVIRRMEDAFEDTYSKVTQESMELNQKFLEIAHGNADAYFEWAREVAGATSPLDFIAVSAKCTHERIETLHRQTRELVAWAQKAAIENMGPMATFVGGAAVGSSELS